MFLVLGHPTRTVTKRVNTFNKNVLQFLLISSHIFSECREKDLGYSRGQGAESIPCRLILFIPVLTWMEQVSFLRTL